jgi:histidine triad (HIT) family protein
MLGARMLILVGEYTVASAGEQPRPVGPGQYHAGVTDDCLFCGIVTGRRLATVVHATDAAVAFRDTNPQAPVHLLVVPREHFPDAASIAAARPTLAGELLHTAAEAAAAVGIADSGYRLVLNTGADAGQSVFHVHCHVLGGRRLAWPPG